VANKLLETKQQSVSMHTYGMKIKWKYTSTTLRKYNINESNSSEQKNRNKFDQIIGSAGIQCREILKHNGYIL